MVLPAMVNPTAFTEDNFADIYQWDNFLWEHTFQMKVFTIPLFPGGTRHLPWCNAICPGKAMCTHDSGVLFQLTTWCRLSLKLYLIVSVSFTTFHYGVENNFEDLKLFYWFLKEINSTGSSSHAGGDKVSSHFPNLKLLSSEITAAVCYTAKAREKQNFK